MKKKYQIIYIISILLICGIPVLTMPIIKYESVNLEKRDLSVLPSLKNENRVNKEFFDQFDEYLLDNFNFRNELVEMNTVLHEKVFGISAESQVVLGKKGWLYFEKTSSDYTKTNTLSNMEIQQINQCIELIKEYALANGCEFRFTIAPNKNSIYPENMPYNYLQKSVTWSNLQALENTLDESNYVSMFDILKNDDGITYLKKDSHWNNYGAYLGFTSIMESFGLDIGFKIVDEEIRADFIADLEGMLYPNGGELDEQIYYTFDKEFEYTSRFKTMDDLSITTVCDETDGSIMVHRDSFGNSLLDYFARQFGEVEFSRVVPYRIDKGVEYDYLLLEIVERNIETLLEQSPVMEMIKRSDVGECIELGDTYIFIEEFQGYYHIYGYADKKVNDIYQVYMEYENAYFEMFPILENCIVGIDRTNVIAFSGYVLTDKRLVEEDITIIYKTD